MHLRQPSSGPGLDACCTCMSFLADIPDYNTINTTTTTSIDAATAAAPASNNDEKAAMSIATETETETFQEKPKPLPPPRQLECCSRYICGRCLHRNDRFAVYCPYCQISQAPSSLPPGLKEPPSYDTAVAGSSGAARVAANNNNKHHPSTDDSTTADPPPYTAHSSSNPPKEKEFSSSSPSPSHDQPPPPDTLHFLNHEHDTLPSLSLAYNVPLPILRRTNNLHSDHLLLGRRTVLIPGSYYSSGISLSPRPVEGEEEELRKNKIRRWMVTCKVHEYDVAVLYLEQTGYDLDAATEAYFADEEWERKNPGRPTNNPGEGGKGKGKGKSNNGGGGGGSGWKIGGFGFGRRKER